MKNIFSTTNLKNFKIKQNPQTIFPNFLLNLCKLNFSIKNFNKKENFFSDSIKIKSKSYHLNIQNNHSLHSNPFSNNSTKQFEIKKKLLNIHSFNFNQTNKHHHHIGDLIKNPETGNIKIYLFYFVRIITYSFLLQHFYTFKYNEN